MRRKQGNIILITLKNNQGSYTFLNKKFKDFSRTHFPFFKDSIQCKKKEPWVFIFCSWTTWAISSWRIFNLCLLLLSLATRESGLDKGSTEIQELSSTDCNFQGLSRSVQTLNNVRCPKDLNVKMSRLFNLIK